MHIQSITNKFDIRVQITVNYCITYLSCISVGCTKQVQVIHKENNLSLCIKHKGISE
jgi:hypothetical protein